MIKRFKSSGVAGVPDCDIIFPDKKIILVQGPNGSGKSSLLRRVTHPFRTTNAKTIPLKEGVEEAFIELDFEYNNETYKIQHSVIKQKNTTKSNSYLMKYINGEYVHMIDDGGVNKFNEYINDNFNFYSNQYDILNIGVNNFGILNMTNADRLKTFKNMLRLDSIDHLTEIIAEKHRTNKNMQIVLDKEINGIKVSDIEVNIQEYSTLLAKLRLELAELKNTTIENVSPETITAIKHNMLSIDNDINDVEKIIAVLADINASGSYNMAKENYTNHINNNNTTKAMMLDRIAEFTEAKNAIKTISLDELNKEKETLTLKINELRESIKEHENILSVMFDTEEYKKYLDKIDFILEDNQYTDKVMEVCNDYEKYKGIIDLEQKSLNKLVDEYTKLNKQLEEATYQENIVSLTPHKDTPDICPLKIEWTRQINNRDKHEQLLSDIEKVSNDMESTTESLNFYKSLSDVARRIINIEKPKDFNKVLGDYKFIGIIPERQKLDSKIAALDMYNIKSLDLNKHEERLNKINTDIEEINSRNIESVSVYEKKIEDAKTELRKAENALEKLKSMKKYFSLDLKTNKFNNDNITILRETLNGLRNEYEIAKESVKKFTKALDDKANHELNIRNHEKYIIDTEVNLNLEKQKLINLEDKIQQKNNLLDMAEKLKNIRDIIQNHLSLKILKPFLKQVEDIVNDLLDGFMTLRFDLDSGKLDMICERDGIDRDVSVLSNGENSMLAIALLMATKSAIPWDIISIDEGSAMLDESNKEKFIYMLRDYANTIPDISQMFIVSHDKVIEEGMDIFKINIQDGKVYY